MSGSLKVRSGQPIQMTMSSFTGSLKIAATADVIDASFVVDDDRLAVRTGDDELGTWPIGELDVERRGDGIHVNLGGEDVVVTVPDMDSFVSEIAPPKRRGRKSKHSKKHRSPVSERPAPAPKARKDTKSLLTRLGGLKELFRRDNWREWLSDSTVRWSIASAGVVIFALLALFATNTLGMVLVLLGMISLIVAALAVSDDLTAYSWIPGELTETTLVIAGAAAMVIGGVFIIIG